MSLAKDLDFVGRNERRRKARYLRHDTREPGVRAELAEVLLEGMGYTLDRLAMLVGDWGWDLRPESQLAECGFKAVCVERKTLADLRDVQRLVNQLSRMNDVYTLFIVLIEEAFDTDRQRAWTDEAVLNAELSIQMRAYNVLVTRCAGGQLAQRIDSLWRWAQKPRHELVVLPDLPEMVGPPPHTLREEPCD